MNTKKFIFYIVINAIIFTIIAFVINYYFHRVDDSHMKPRVPKATQSILFEDCNLIINYLPRWKYQVKKDKFLVMYSLDDPNTFFELSIVPFKNSVNDVPTPQELYPEVKEFLCVDFEALEIDYSDKFFMPYQLRTTIIKTAEGKTIFAIWRIASYLNGYTITCQAQSYLKTKLQQQLSVELHSMLNTLRPSNPDPLQR